MTKIYGIFKDEDGLADYLDSTPVNSRGGFSEVWYLKHKGEKLVLKVTEDEAYLNFLSWVMENQHLSAVPKINDVEIINNTHYVLMEKLYYTNHHCDSEAQDQGWYEHDPAVWRVLGDNCLDKVLDLLENRFNWAEMCWDLRDSNIMQRKDGSLVVTDPWSELPYNEDWL